MNKGDRSFTVEKSEVKTASESPRYVSKTPGAAAAKAARRIFAEIKDAKKTEVRFSIRETTQDSAKKEYKYIGIRQKLDKPKVLAIAGKDISITHEFKVKSCRI